MEGSCVCVCVCVCVFGNCIFRLIFIKTPNVTIDCLSFSSFKTMTPMTSWYVLYKPVTL